MFDPTIVSNLVLILTAWGAAFLVVFWVSLVFWAYRDIRKRTGDKLLQILAVIVVTLLFLPGVLVYLMLRPQQTLEEEYQATLEEEALLYAIENTHHCPGCSRKINEKWIVCPECHTRLQKTCHHCSRLMELQWNICPYCATPAPGMKKEIQTFDEALRPSPVDEDDGEETF